MPTITVNRRDFEGLLGRPAPIEKLHSWLTWVKGEVKDEDPGTGDLRIELQDSNRPDLWSCEGVARQVRAKLEGHGPRYTFFSSNEKAVRNLCVSADLEGV